MRRRRAPDVLPLVAPVEAAIGEEFDRLTRQVLAEIDELLIAGGVRRDAVSTRELFRMLENRTNPRAILERLFSQVSQEEADALRKQLPTIPLPSVVSNGARLQEAWVSRNVDLIRAAEPVKKAIEKTLAQPLNEGVSVGEIRKQLQRELGISKRRAQLIARDQTLKLAGQLAEARQKQAGIRRYVWTTSADERVRPDHAELDGQTFEWAKPPVVDKRTGRRGHPGDDFQCLPGDSQIGFTGPVNRAFRRWYRGQLTQLVTDSGEPLECTPNHPVLTFSGWQPAERVQVGDYIFQVGECRGELPEADVENGVPLIADVFQTLALTFGLRWQRGITAQFHGDGVVDEQVEIVDVDGELRPDVEAALAQNLSKLDFANPDPTRLRLCDADAMLNRLGLSSASGIGGLRLRLASFLWRLRESRDVRCASPAWLHSLPFQEGFDSCAGNSEALRKRLDGGTCDIRLEAFILREWLRVWRRSVPRASAAAASADRLAEVVFVAGEQPCDFVPGPALVAKALRVVKKSGRVFEGHVFNLSTECNWYVAQRRIVHNCRCTADPVLEEDLQEAPEAQPAPVGESPPDPISAQQELEAQRQAGLRRLQEAELRAQQAQQAAEQARRQAQAQAAAARARTAQQEAEARFSGNVQQFDIPATAAGHERAAVEALDQAGLKKLFPDRDLGTVQISAQPIMADGARIGGTYQSAYKGGAALRVDISPEVLKEFVDDPQPIGDRNLWAVASSMKNETDVARAVVTHEFGHAVHMKDYLSDTWTKIEEVINRAHASPEFISQYANFDKQEYFAEAFAAYHLHRDWLRKNAPRAFEMVRDVLKIRGLL